MIDLRAARANPEPVRAALARKGAAEAFDDLLEADDLYLTGTSEVALAGMHTGEILEAAELPIRYSGFSTCFRREAGAPRSPAATSTARYGSPSACRNSSSSATIRSCSSRESSGRVKTNISTLLN